MKKRGEKPDYFPQEQQKGNGGTDKQLVIFSYGHRRGISSLFVKAKIVGSKHEKLEKIRDTGHIMDYTFEPVIALLAH